MFKSLRFNLFLNDFFFYTDIYTDTVGCYELIPTYFIIILWHSFTIKVCQNSNAKVQLFL